MTKWNIFRKTEKKKKLSEEIEKDTQDSGQSDEETKTSQCKEEQEEIPNIVYNEILYTKDYKLKNAAIPSERKQPVKRLSWENIDTIEQNVDNIGYKKTDTNKTRSESFEEIDQKVDHIIIKKKIR